MRRTEDDAKREIQLESCQEALDSLCASDLAELYPYVREHTDGVGYEIDDHALSTYGVREKIWERYTYVEEMSAAESRKLASQEEANKGAVDAVSDTLKLKEYLRGRK
jgi:hypothetical protein